LGDNGILGQNEVGELIGESIEDKPELSRLGIDIVNDANPGRVGLGASGAERDAEEPGAESTGKDVQIEGRTPSLLPLVLSLSVFPLTGGPHEDESDGESWNA